MEKFSSGNIVATARLAHDKRGKIIATACLSQIYGLK